MNARLALLAALALASCSDDRLVGKPVVDETTNGVQARFLLPDGQPAAAARIEVAPSWHLAGLDTATVRARTADSSGRWDASELPPGEYVLEVRTASLGLRTRLTVPSGGKGGEFVRSVAPLSTIRGSTTPGAILRAYGSDRTWSVGASGDYVLDSLPSGTWVLRADLPTPRGDSLLGEAATNAFPEDTVVAQALIGIVSTPDTWARVLRLTIPPQTDLPETLSHAMVPLTIRARDIPSDPGELRIVEESGKVVPFTVDEWDPASGSALVWAHPDTVHPRRGDAFQVLWGKTGIPVLPPATMPGSLHGIWHLSSQASAAEASGRGPAIAADSGTLPSVGILGSARSFDGNDVLRIPPPPDSALARAFTVSCWVLPEGVQAGWAKILDLGSANAPFGTILLDIDSTTGRPAFQMAFSDGTWQRIVATASLSGWTHLAATWDGSVATFHVNGIRQGTFASSIAPFPTAGHDLLVGNQEGGLNGFSGRIDEIRFDLDVRPAERIRYDAVLPRVPPD